MAAISAGIVDGVPLLDLDYSEDSTAEVDANVVMTGDGGLVEVQATAERTPLSRAHLDDLLALAANGHRRAAHAAGRARDRRRATGEARPRHAATRTSCASSRRCWPRTRSIRCPTTSTCRPRPATTFADNALGKARAAAAATGRAAIADDSGIEAAALGGAPGVRSARYAGEDATDEENLAKLLREAPAGARVAYVCALAYVEPDGRESWSRAAAPARWPPSRAGRAGSATTRRSCPTSTRDRTMAELAPEEKAAISHRGRAARALLDLLAA